MKRFATLLSAGLMLAPCAHADTLGPGEMQPWSCDLPTLRITEPALPPNVWVGKPLVSDALVWMPWPNLAGIGSPVPHHPEPQLPSVALPAAGLLLVSGLAALGLRRARG